MTRPYVGSAFGRLQNMFQGEGLAARAIRSSAFTAFGYGSHQVIRLAANLILTRLLFPEAFGMMALVFVFIQGLNNFSDMGTSASIMQNKRGDDLSFLNTAWTLQVGRGILLWLGTFIIAVPVAQFYDAPQLAQLLPVVGLTLVINGCNPTRLDTASRHLNLGRVTLIELVTQLCGVLIAVIFAWYTGSIWALVVSALGGSLIQLYLLMRYLPGDGNKLALEKEALRELLTFGKWIFLSTIAGFFVSQGDKMVLGKYVSLELLGIYNIGYFLASFPALLGGVVVRRVLIPIYREVPAKESKVNFAKLRKMRFAITSVLLVILVILAFISNWLVTFLYDPRYALAAGVLLAIAFVQLPQVIVLTYDHAALAAGDSKQFFTFTIAKAVLIIAGLLIGAETFGLLGAMLGQAVAMLLMYPVIVWLARRHGIWDPLHDAGFALIGVALLLVAVSFNISVFDALVALNSP